MAMELVDEDDVWGDVATSPRASSPPSLSLNTRLQLLAASGGSFHPGVGSPFLSGFSAGYLFHPGGGYNGNVAASPSSPLFSAAASPFSRLEREMFVAPAAVAGSSGGPEDRRKKRMIKNRETASRSRLRKHKYVTKIESEVIELREENEQLCIKFDELKASLEVSVPVRKTLQRVLSAPF